MKHLAILVALMGALTCWAQTDTPKQKTTDIGFGAMYSLLGAGDDKAFMNEISLNHRFGFAGVKLGANYVHSSSQGSEFSYFGDFYDTGHSQTHIYARLNFYIVPIQFGNFSFEVGGGALTGHASYVNSGYHTILSNMPVNISNYEADWFVGYNLQLSMNYQMGERLGLAAVAGYDNLTDLYSNSYIGMRASYRLQGMNR